MQVAIEIPESLSARLTEHWGNLPRRALEAVAVEAYRDGALTTHEIQQLLGLASRWEVDAFLKQAGAWLDYSEADLESDIEAIRATRGQ